MAKAPPVKKAPTPLVQVETPAVVQVKHKVTGKVFEVSRSYYEAYSQVLEIV